MTFFEKVVFIQFYYLESAWLTEINHPFSRRLVGLMNTMGLRQMFGSAAQRLVFFAPSAWALLHKNFFGVMVRVCISLFAICERCEHSILYVVRVLPKVIIFNAMCVSGKKSVFLFQESRTLILRMNRLLLIKT